MIDDEEKLSKDRYTRWTRSLSARKIKKKGPEELTPESRERG